MKEWLDRYTTIKTANLIASAINYTTKLLVAIVLLLIGFWLINRLLKIAEKTLHIKNFDPTFKKFTRNLLNFGLKTVLIISVLNFAGFPTTSVIAIVGAAGLAVGLALQGTLTNFAGGVLLLLFKPFKVGDTIEAQGKKGVVSEVQIFTTIMVTDDNRTIFIPNSMLSNGIIENHTNKKDIMTEGKSSL
jgi:small conductance mechanosensitive channel